MAVGLQALFDDKEFQLGVARYVSALNRVTGDTQRTAVSMTNFGHTISTAIGSALGFLSAQAIPKIAEALTAPISITRAWGEQLDTLGDTFGMNSSAATGFAVALRTVGMNVDEGAGAFSYFTRQVEQTKDQMVQAGSAFSDTAQEIRNNFVKAQVAAAESLANVWSDFRDKRVEIEASLAESIASINEGLAEHLSDLAAERLDIDRDLDKSLTKLDRNMKDRIRSARGRERRELRKEWKEQRQDLIDQANERKAQVDKEEMRAKQQAEKQIALAEKVAAKQIEASEKAANKQVEAIEKGLQKEQEARDEALKKAAKSLGGAQAQSPLAKALKSLGLDFKKVTDEGRPFEERLGEIMDAFSKLPEGVDASALAIQLFGRAGLRWLDFLRLGKQGLEDAKKLGIDLGLVLDPSEVEAFSRQLNQLQLGFDAFGVTIGKLVLPYAKDFVTWLNSSIKEGMPVLRGLLDQIAKGFKEEGLTGAFKALQTWVSMPANQQKINDAIKAVSQVLSDLWTAFIGTTKFVGDALNALFDAVGRWAGTPEGQTAITSAVAWLGQALSNALTAFVKTSTAVLQFLSALGARVIEWAGTADAQNLFQSMASAFVAGFGNALEAEMEKQFPWLKYFGVASGFKFGLPSFHSGGWVPQTGPAMLRAGEYVLNPTQASVMAPVLSPNYSRSYQVNVQNQVYGNSSEVDLSRIRQASYEGAMRGVRDAARGA